MIRSATTGSPAGSPSAARAWGAPSWSGLIAITDQGLELNGVGPLSNAQSSLYQLSSSNFHDITTGSNGGYKAGPGYDLVTGIGTPIANLLVPALVALDTPPDTRLPGSPGLGTPTGSAPVFSHLSVNPSDTIQAPSLNGMTISSATEPVTNSSTSITALIPNTTSTTVNWTVVPVIIVPAPPPPPLVTHMGASTAPVTAQSSIAISLVEEQPTGLTHFGQGLDNERGKLFEERLDTRPTSSSWIDIVEPIQPPAAPHSSERRANHTTSQGPSSTLTGSLPCGRRCCIRTLRHQRVDRFDRPIFFACRQAGGRREPHLELLAALRISRGGHRRIPAGDSCLGPIERPLVASPDQGQAMDLVVIHWISIKHAKRVKTGTTLRAARCPSSRDQRVTQTDGI